MSGVMIKVALYGLIRVLFSWSPAPPAWLGVTVLGLGALSAVGGVLYALFEHELKRLLAFHSIENVGIITLGLGASLLFASAGRSLWAGIAFAAALLHTLNHAVFKALLFLGAGAIERAVHGQQIDHLGGLLRRMPWTAGCFLIGSMAIAGLPPLNGFASEWLTLQALLHLPLDGASAPWLGPLAAAALAATAALAVLCFVKVTGLALLGQPRHVNVARAREVSWAMRGAQLTLAGPCVGLGLLPGLLLPALASLRSGSPPLSHSAGLDLPGTGGLPTVAIALVLATLTLLAALARRGRPSAAPAPVWTCGQVVEPSLAWTSSAFTKPLRLTWEPVLRPGREITVHESGGILQAVEYRGHVPHLFDTVLYAPAIRAALAVAERARGIQSGSLRSYAVYLGAMVVVLLVLVRTGVLG
jgi:hydrogenase-4 component B